MPKRKSAKRRSTIRLQGQALKRDETTATQYAVDVLRGAVVTGPWVHKACERHCRDLVKGHERGLTFNADLANRVQSFFHEFLKLSDGQFDGKPFLLEPWQAFIVQSLIGWQKADGFRRFSVGFCEVGKGNGKTPLAGALGIYGLLLDNEQSAEIYSAATTREQAGILFRDAVKMVEASPELKSLIKVHQNNLAELGGYSFFRPVSSEHRGLDGKRVHMALLDEIQEHPTDLVVSKMLAGRKGRRQPLQFEITNSGHDRTSVAYVHHDYSTRVLDGTVDNDGWFAYVCGLDDGDEPFDDASCWVKVNPNLGVSIEPGYLETQVREAKGMPSIEAIVRRLNFCQWTRTRLRAIDLAQWDQCPDINERALTNLPCWGGLDLGMSDDWSAFAIVWQFDDNRYAIKCHFWIPEDTTRREDGRPYDAWLDSGLVTVTPGSVTDYDVVEQDVFDTCQKYGIREVGFDKRFAQHLAHHLVGAGITMVDQPQGFHLNEATVKLQELITAGKLHHDRNPILTWMMGNLVVKTGRFNEVRPDKQESSEKVDGVVAGLIALSRCISQPEDGVSVYEDRGILSI